MSKQQAWILLVLCNLFWAGNYVFGKYAIEEMSPLWITFSRWLLALFLLFPAAFLLERPDWKQLWKAWLPLAGMGILGVIAYNLLLYSALAYTSPTNAALVSALNPAVIVLFSYFLLRERISGLQGTGIAVSLFGVLIILTSGNLQQLFSASYNPGDLLMIAAVLAWTFYSIIGKRLTGVPPITATAVSTLIATVIMAPFAFVEGIQFDRIGPLAVTAIVYMTLFPSLGSFVFWNMSVRAIGASRAGIFLNLIPVFTALISVILGESISAVQIFGGLLVFAGVYLTTGIQEKRPTIAMSPERKAGDS
jgi:drug/metabolite transporter (DMT)-like permease